MTVWRRIIGGVNSVDSKRSIYSIRLILKGRRREERRTWERKTFVSGMR
jgi:hypothetical protein